MTESVATVFDRLVAAAPPPSASVQFETACVLGGSVAGLLAARVLADHANRVVVIERDLTGTGTRPGARRGSTSTPCCRAAWSGWSAGCPG